MTRGEFLRWAAAHTPWTPRPITDIPGKWLSAAWGRAWARHADFLDGVCRDISKLGGNLGEGGPCEYGRSLTVEEQVGLFRSIRNYAPWMEPCWRPWFERSFPESARGAAAGAHAGRVGGGESRGNAAVGAQRRAVLSRSKTGAAFRRFVVFYPSSGPGS
jgi:hypothetical protein